MGPIIILDKSTLQSLSQSEITFLFKHYFVVVTPILIAEIQADLSKNKDESRLSEKEVTQLSNKLLSYDSVINDESRNLCFASLLGYEVPMKGVALVRGGIPLKTRDGEKGIFFDEPSERKILRGWQDGIFSDTDKAVAQQWREVTQALNLQDLKKIGKDLLKNMPKIKRFEELNTDIQKYVSRHDHALQFSFLNRSIEQIGVPGEKKNIIYNRWLNERIPLFRDFAPYAFYCLRVKMLFTFGLVADLVSPKPTNLIDLEYLYYLPFCMVFSSGDNFHKDISRLLLREDQVFVDRDTLKKDLQWLVSEWNGLSETEKTERAYNYGDYPPKNSESITYQLWLKYMKPWKPGFGNLAIKRTKKENEEIMKELKPWHDAINEYLRKKKNK